MRSVDHSGSNVTIEYRRVALRLLEEAIKEMSVS